MADTIETTKDGPSPDSSWDSSTPEEEDRLSLLGDLAARRQQIVADLYLDLPVPRWEDPEVYVRLRPLDIGEIDEVQRAYRKSERAAKRRADPNAVLNSNTDLVIRACEGVFAVLDSSALSRAIAEHGADSPEADSHRYSLNPENPRGEWTKFDPALATNLGLTGKATARQVVLKLFLAEGDIMTAANKLTRWSGIETQQADEDFLED